MPNSESSNETINPRRHVADVLFDAVSRVASSRVVENKIEELPALSLYTFVTAIMTLGNRIVKVAKFELGVAEIMTWKRPALTFTVLFGYSALCYYPQWLLLLPLFYFTFFVLVPNYADKFKLETGKESSSLTEPILIYEDHKDDENQNQSRSILMAVKQGQQSLTKIVAALDKLDEFQNGPVKFADAQVSCIMLISACTALISAGYLLTLVSVPFFFTLSGWCLVLSKHPLAKLTSEKLEDLYIEPSLDINSLVARITNYCHNHVLIDEKPLRKVAEIYEIQPQGLTARLWDETKIVYSCEPYGAGSHFRSNKLLPHGVSEISEIEPPEGWYFDLGDAWEIDNNPQLWCSLHGLTQVEIDGPWVYDIGTEESRWRRRRRTRTCYYDPR